LLLFESDDMSSVSVVSLIALLGGACVAFIGTILLLIAAFRQSIIWGLVVLFVPLGVLIYACVHWADAKTGFLAHLIGVGICIGAVFSMPGVQQQFWTSVSTSTGQAAPATPNLDQQIQDQRQKIESLQAAFAQDGVDLTKQYQLLGAQRKALKPGDTAAITKFNESAAVYQARNVRRKQMQQDMDAAQKQLDGLLEQRSRERLAAGPSASK
jgi:hypothetical protein